MTLPSQLKALIEAAEKATPGPWIFESTIYEYMFAGIRAIPDDRGLCQIWNHEKAGDDATFIALANPQAILAIAAENVALTSALSSALNRVEELEAIVEAEIIS